jgi:hypothetical protein
MSPERVIHGLMRQRVANGLARSIEAVPGLTAVD